MGVDGTGRRALLVAVAVAAAFGLAVAGWLVFGRSSPRKTATAAPALTVATSGNDSTCARGGPACATFNKAYQLAQPGDTVTVAAGAYPGQTLEHKSGTDGLRCSLGDTTDCIHFVGTGVTLTGSIENYASDLWLDGGIPGPGWQIHGYINTTSGDSGGPNPTTLPDHVIAQGLHTTTVNLSGASDVVYRYIDAGPATVSTNCQGLEGPISENKISINGVGPGPTVPRNILWDHIHFHDQNGDSGRIASDCHWGGLFIVNGNGVTISNSTFDHNVVYNVQVQNFAGPPVTNLTFDHDSFGCPVEWLYTGYGVCDRQSSIQFDYRGNGFPSNVTIKDSAFGEPLPGWACVDPPCDFSTFTYSNNVGSPTLTPNPPPLNGPVPTTTTLTTPTTTTPTTTRPTTTTTTTTQPSTTTTVPTTTVPFIPNVPLATREITLTLDWMHSTRKTGGLGYSVAQVKTTHAYRALVALGGAWNG